MNKAIIKLLGLVVVAGTLSACSGTVTVQTDPYVHAWYDVYGNYCGTGYPTAGCNFYANGAKIIANEDPYYNNRTYYFDFWTYTDSYGYPASYLGYAWLSSTGILYDDYGRALNELDDTAQSADVIAQAAVREDQVAKAVGKALADKYALNEEKGVMISKTLQDWAKLGKDRTRTGEDTIDYAKRLYGIDKEKTQKAFSEALATKSQKPLEELNVDIAAYWGTEPEVSAKMLKAWYKNEVAAYGIK